MPFFTFLAKIPVIGAIVVAAAAGFGVVAALKDDGVTSSPSPQVERGTETTVGGAGGERRGEPLVVRALGDSVTAAFGYYADGSAVPRREIIGANDLVGIGRCQPPDPPDGRCQAPRTVAYPAVFAKRERVPLRRPYFDNLAISGSTPFDWSDPRGEFRDELDQIVRDDPDITVLTLGANPLLGEFVADVGNLCARTALIRRCIRTRLERNDVVADLAEVYRLLLGTKPDGRQGQVFVFQYHHTAPLPARGPGSQVEVLFDELRTAITTAVRQVHVTDPSSRRRLTIVEPPSFSDHGCGADEPWVLLTDLCIHPNALGHQQFAASLAQALKDAGAPSRRLPQPAQVASACETLTLESHANGQAIRVELQVEDGQVACTESRDLVEGYWNADGPCDRMGAGTCWRDQGEWECVAPTAGSYPVVVRCSGAGEAIRAVDTEAFPVRGRQRECGNVPDYDVGKPGDIVANIGCDEAVRVALAAADENEERLNFSCRYEEVGVEHSKTVCSWDDRRVEFETIS